MILALGVWNYVIRDSFIQRCHCRTAAKQYSRTSSRDNNMVLPVPNWILSIATTKSIIVYEAQEIWTEQLITQTAHSPARKCLKWESQKDNTVYHSRLYCHKLLPNYLKQWTRCSTKLIRHESTASQYLIGARISSWDASFSSAVFSALTRSLASCFLLS